MRESASDEHGSRVEKRCRQCNNTELAWCAAAVLRLLRRRRSFRDCWTATPQGCGASSARVADGYGADVDLSKLQKKQAKPAKQKKSNKTAPLPLIKAEDSTSDTAFVECVVQVCVCRAPRSAVGDCNHVRTCIAGCPAHAN